MKIFKAYYEESIDETNNKGEKVNDLITRDKLVEINKNEKISEERLREMEWNIKSIEKYSTFKIDDIGLVLIDLFLLFKGNSYEFSITTTHDSLIGINSYYLDNGEEKVELAKLYWKNDQIIQFYKSENNFSKKSILVTTHPIMKNQFVKSFITYVIEYRIKNKVNDISLSTLKKLLKEFVIDRHKEIEIIQSMSYKRDLKAIKEKKAIREKALLRVISFEE